MNVASAMLVGVIRLYRRFVSPLFPPTCRFSPSCSQYAVDAIQHRGIVRGSWLAFKRFIKCHPWHPGGYDPVPGVEKPEYMNHFTPNHRH